MLKQPPSYLNYSIERNDPPVLPPYKSVHSNVKSGLSFSSSLKHIENPALHSTVSMLYNTFDVDSPRRKEKFKIQPSKEVEKYETMKLKLEADKLLKSYRKNLALTSTNTQISRLNKNLSPAEEIAVHRHVSKILVPQINRKTDLPLLYTSSSANASKSISSNATIARMTLVANSPGINLATETTKKIISEPIPGPGTLPYVVKKAAPKYKQLLSPNPNTKNNLRSPRLRQPLYASPNLPSNWPANLAFIEHITPDTLNEVNYMLYNDNIQENNYRRRRRSTQNFNNISNSIIVNNLNRGSSTSRRNYHEEELDLDRTYVNNQYLLSP